MKKFCEIYISSIIALFILAGCKSADMHIDFNNRFISMLLDNTEVLALAFLVGIICLMLYLFKKDPVGFNRGNPYVEGGIKNRKIRLAVLIIGCLCPVIRGVIILVDWIGG